MRFDIVSYNSKWNNHLSVYGNFYDRVIIIYPKNELAQANQALVLPLGLCTEND